MLCSAADARALAAALPRVLPRRPESLSLPWSSWISSGRHPEEENGRPIVFTTCFTCNISIQVRLYGKQVGGPFLRIRPKIAKKRGLELGIFSCMKRNVFRSFFAFRLEIHVRWDNQYKTGADSEKIFWDSRGCLSAWVYGF